MQVAGRPGNACYHRGTTFDPGFMVPAGVPRRSTRHGVNSQNESTSTRTSCGRSAHGAQTLRQTMRKQYLSASGQKRRASMASCGPPPRPGFPMRKVSLLAIKFCLHLAGLVGDVRDRAEEYVRRAPAEIATPYRAEIERQLEWMPIAQQAPL